MLESDRKFNTSIFEKLMELPWWQKLMAVMFAGLLFAVLLDVVFFPWYTRHGKEYPLPDVTELNLPKALESLEDRGFIPIILDSVYDSSSRVGIVVRQNPTPGSIVKKGRRVYLVVSRGERPILVPNLVGMTIQDARFRIRENGLELNDIYREFSEEQPYKGTVIRQSLPAGTEVTYSKRISLTVSMGPPPSSRTIPEVIGKSLEVARRELESLGITIGRIDYSLRENLVPNTVVGQSVMPGTRIDDNLMINLMVSTDRVIEE